MAWSRKCVYKGIKFDSEKERDRYIELELLEYGGYITDLQPHPKFLLQEAFSDRFTGKKIAAITYEGDFQYIENGITIVEDVKALTKKGKILQTEASKVRMKLAKFRYPRISFRVVGR